jgi:hypothetical protein
MKARRLIDVVDHFRDAHPVVASRGWYEEFDMKTKKPRIRTWQGYVDEERLELVLEPEVDPHRPFPDREGRGGSG